MVVMFAAVIIMNIPTLASFAVTIYDAIDTAFEFLPLIALVGALAFLGGRGSK